MLHAAPRGCTLQAAQRLSAVAGWLGKTQDQAHFANVSRTILLNLRTQLCAHPRAQFVCPAAEGPRHLLLLRPRGECPVALPPAAGGCHAPCPHI